MGISQHEHRHGFCNWIILSRCCSGRSARRSWRMNSSHLEILLPFRSPKESLADDSACLHPFLADWMDHWWASLQCWAVLARLWHTRAYASHLSSPYHISNPLTGLSSDYYCGDMTSCARQSKAYVLDNLGSLNRHGQMRGVAAIEPVRRGDAKSGLGKARTPATYLTK